MPNLLFCVGKAVADVGLVELMGAAGGDPMVIAGLVARIGMSAWKQWQEDKKQDKLNADVLAAAKLSFDEAKQAAAEVAKQVTTDPQLQDQVERFVTLVPASIRASLRRPEDPTGTSVPNNFAVEDADDLVKLLPARLSRFKPGDTPHFLRGWRLVEQIGAGGFGEVWKAQNTRAGNLVNAVKFGHGLSEAEQTLLNEGDVLNRILGEGHHDGIVKLLDVWADGDAVPWLRYEYIAGGDLTAQIHQWQRLPAEKRIDRVLDAWTQIASTVGYFHTLNPFIVHRDLKPSNILYDPVSKRFKVADFGIGGVSSRRLLSAEQIHSLTAGAVVASYLRGSHTPLYASPQQRAGSKLLDPRDDVHALGVIAFQMVTGQLDAAPGPDVEHDMGENGVPAELIALVKACTARDSNRRPKDAAEVSERLRTLARSTPHPPEPPVPATSPMRGEVEVVDDSRPVTAVVRSTSDSSLMGEVAGASGANPAKGRHELPVPRLRGASPNSAVPVAKAVRAAGNRFDLELPGGVTMRFAWCPPGTFLMGCERGWLNSVFRLLGEGRDEKPVHPVTLTRGFFAGIHPVTQEQWGAVMGTSPSHFKGATLPVEMVSWDDAREFCRAARETSGRPVRLPTEAEWEYACRAGTATEYHWGDEPTAARMNANLNPPWDNQKTVNYRAGTTPVGTFPPNPWGLYDCHGNVQEWCEDWYDGRFYSRSPKVDPVCTDGNRKERVSRGGEWFFNSTYTRSAHRFPYPPAVRSTHLGFRVVFNVD